MRRVVTHGYDQLDEDELWQVIEKDIPELIRKIAAILHSAIS